ncbi:flavin reductase [Microbacterium betulae]|uniref:Flavin reductase n=1 Tax=Microbacterium betulae TaxID=2981139 RepID=A0AA97I5J5_9MICO|nr:flavin reductase [Microbacterium sp. AB]WOF22874.1 flavin reductase [Microbacterium sp. AB]
MSIDSVPEMIDEFRQAAGRFASGVTVVTTRNGEHVYGVTATSFVSLSLNPLLVTVSINTASAILPDIDESGILAVNVLAREQEEVSRYFSTRGRGRSRERFEGIAAHVESTGAPIIDGALSWFDCRVHTTLEGGDHVILVGEVVAAGGSSGEPLLYWSGGYRELGRNDDPSGGDDGIEQFADALSVQLHMHGMTPADLLDAQYAVEPAAAALAARACTDELVAELQSLIDEAAEHHDDAERYNPVALEFHSRIGSMSGNAAIAASVRALSRPRYEVYSSQTNAERASRSTRKHQEIADAIRDHDEDRARALMLEHLGTIARGIA